jgi:hypothetical protein
MGIPQATTKATGRKVMSRKDKAEYRERFKATLEQITSLTRRDITSDTIDEQTRAIRREVLQEWKKENPDLSTQLLDYFLFLL